MTSCTSSYAKNMPVDLAPDLCQARRLGGVFRDYWLTHGGLFVSGLPITEEITEISPTDGQSYKVQYFERARYEYHPENAPPFDVLLGLLGNQLVQQKGWIP
jgi:hypothetical protein